MALNQLLALMVMTFLLLVNLCDAISFEDIEWIHFTDGYWSSTANWNTSQSPHSLSNVLFTPPSSPITVSIESHVIISNLTLVDDITLLFTNNASLTVLNYFTAYGGTLQSHSSSLLSNTSIALLILDCSDFSLVSHSLIVTLNISWYNGLFSLDEASTLILNNTQFSIGIELETSDLQGSNEVHVWGINSGGKLGTGDHYNIDYPQSVFLPSPVQQVSMGYSHSLVLLSSGDVYSCGSNYYSQRGQTHVDPYLFNQVHIPKAFQIQAGQFSSFAVVADGTFYCWGRNNEFQLGLIPKSTSSQAIPVLNDYIDDVIQLAGTRNSMFALRSNGELYSWGGNPDACLCLGHGKAVDHPTLIEDIPPVEFVASGVTTYLIYRNGTTAFCGQLTTNSDLYSTPQFFDSSRRFVFISTVARSAIALDEDQRMWTWGSNTYGQLGDGTTETTLVPIEPLVNTTILSVSSAVHHKVAVDEEGLLMTWGRSDIGRLARTGSNDVTRVPGEIPGFNRSRTLVVSSNRDATIAYERMSPGVPPGFEGNGTLVLDNSELRLMSMTVFMSQISLQNSVLISGNVSFENVGEVISSSSSLKLTDFTVFSSNEIEFHLDNSDLYFEEDVVVSSSIILIAINSQIEYLTLFFPLHLVDLTYSRLSSNLINDIAFNSLDCSHCQLLTKQRVNVTDYLKINSGKISAKEPLEVYFHFFSDVKIQNSVSILNIDVDFKHDIFLFNTSLLLDQDLVVHRVLSGSGVIESNVLNYGTVFARNNLDFYKSLSLSSSSNLKFLLSSSFEDQVSIADDVYLSGMLEIEVILSRAIIGSDFELIRAGQLFGHFDEIRSNCKSIISLSFSTSSVLASFNDYILELNQVSYISTTGFDDTCCGTINSPCASFRGVLERMGSKGTVYFHEGSYSLIKDWER
ncbi:hypothetical protein GEMRC1_007214 [Eukaryota sp. GEM-RC1]